MTCTRNYILRASLALSAAAFLVGGCMQPATQIAPAGGGASLPNRPEELPALSALEFDTPEPYVTTLPNRIKLFVLEDHSLPLVNIDVLVGCGARVDDLSQVGTAAFTANTMRRGGTDKFPGNALDDTLDFLGANLSVGMGIESADASLNVLTEHLDTGLEILADVLMHPAFPQEKIDELSRITIESIRRRDDDPYQIGRRKFRQLVYGSDNPWARQLEIEDVNRVSRDALVAFHQTWFRPNITSMAIAGDIDADEIVAAIEDAFAEWESAPVPEIAPTVPNSMEPGVYIYEKDVAQAAVRMGTVGMPRHSEDQYAVEVMNRIFGAGTFTSRLGTEVRSNRGLAYYVYGAVFSDPDPSQGMLLALAGTRVDKTAEAIGVMRAIIDSMDTQPITDAELRSSKDQIANSFVFAYSSADQIVSRQMSMEYEGYPDDYLDTYIQRIEAVTAEDVQRVAREYLDAENLRIIVVANPSDFDRPLDEYGPVNALPSDAAVATESPE